MTCETSVSERKKGPIYLSGEKVGLAPYDHKVHNESSYHWINSSAIRSFLSNARAPIGRAAEEEWSLNASRGQTGRVQFAIVTMEDHRHIGNIGLENIDDHDRHACAGIFIGEEADWGQRLGVEAITLLLFYAFKWRNLNRVYGHIVVGNERSIRCCLKCGLKREGRFRQHLFVDGKYVDVIQMAILQSRWFRLARDGKLPLDVSGVR